MLPAIGESEEKTIVEFLTEKEEFHLDYENHLKPFVLKTADAVTHEIVESHIEVCPECLGDLRDLMEFHETLERETQEKSGFWTSLQKLLTNGNWRILALASLLIATVAGIFWLSRMNPEPPPEEAEVQSPKSKVQSLPSESPMSNVHRAKTAESPKFNAQTPKPETEQVKPSESTESEIQHPPSQIPNPKSDDFVELKLPAVLNKLKPEKNETYRSDNDNETPKQAIKIVSPNGLVIRENTPLLRWENVAGIEKYEVKIFDNDDNALTGIDDFTSNSWRAPNLSGGKIYQWQVFAKKISPDGKTANLLGQGKFYIISRHDENRIAQAKNALARGRAFAEAGLLREAALEFRKYLKENPNSENVKKFLRQVEK